MINTREELIVALREASEIEHGLLIQYLFAALSMKKRLDEGITAPQQRLIRNWEGIMLGIAVEEMGHLGTVCNLLSAVGGGPRFKRPNFPQQSGYYPFSFDLLPFSDKALYRFQIFELPRGFPTPPQPDMPLGALRERLAVPGEVVPEPLEYEYVGELYTKIREGFKTIPEKELFIGPPNAQTGDDWSITLDIRKVGNRSESIAAIEDIIQDGEGTSGSRSNSHYGRFSVIRHAFAEESRFEAGRQIAANPRTRVHRDAPGSGTLITHPYTKRIAELFNAVYSLLLRMLLQYFSFGGESPNQREVLRSSAARLMSVAIRPLAEVLTELPISDEDIKLRAGPTFELYDDVVISPHPAARWIILLESFDAIIDEAFALRDESHRMGSIGQTISIMRRAVADAAREA